MKQTVLITATAGSGIYLFGNHTGLIPHEAAIAVAFAGAIAIAMYGESSKISKKDFYVFSFLSMIFAAIVAASIRSYFELTDEHALTVAALSGITAPFFFYDIKKWMPRFARTVIAKLQELVIAIIDRFKPKPR